MTRVTAPLAKILLACAALMLSLPAIAGNLSFTLSLTGTQLTVTNQGDSTAFYPAAFKLLPDGSWEQLKANSTPAELVSGALMQFIWPDIRPQQQLSELERMQPVMLRFFDQAGVAFGQISFFHAAPAAKFVLTAAYVNGLLRIESPDGKSPIHASWVLWPQEDGIKPIRQSVHFEHHQPPARRIDWQRQGRAPFQFDTGAGQPAAILVHETAQGYAIQHVPGGGLRGREQRAAWLDATPTLYAAALIALAIGVAALVVQFLLRPRAVART